MHLRLRAVRLRRHADPVASDRRSLEALLLILYRQGMGGTAVATWRTRLGTAYRVQPASVVFPTAMAIIGVAVVILGEHASRAFTNLGGDFTIRGMGLALSIGGLVSLLGIMRADTLVEAIGLVALASGAAVYATGVTIGLWPTQGLVAGTGFAAITVWALARVLLVLRAARALRDL